MYIYEYIHMLYTCIVCSSIVLSIILLQLSIEKRKQERLSSGDNTKELEEAQAQVERLQSELKVRMKLNQLQSTKVWLAEQIFVHYIIPIYYSMQMQELLSMMSATEGKSN